MTNPISSSKNRQRVLLQDIATVKMGQSPPSSAYNSLKNGMPLIQGNNHIDNDLTISRIWTSTVTKVAKEGDIVLSVRAPVGDIARAHTTVCLGRGVCSISSLYNPYLWYYLKYFTHKWKKFEQGSTFSAINSSDIKNLSINLPPLPEQNRIVAVLETWDKAIEKLEEKIEVKNNTKRSLLQTVLTGNKRLPGYTDDWEAVKLSNIAKCLDGQRVPLNSESRRKRKGTIPYCGANGVVDYINDYIFDEDIILIAEDGGYFDQYQTRPIAYRMQGKCWVNNHAHVITAKQNFSQDLLYYLTVHKNILKYVNGGTRAKLNKSELMNIEYSVPHSQEEQKAIAEILNTADQEIDLLQGKLALYEAQKKYLLNNLVTGNIRTPERSSINLSNSKG